MEKTIKAWWKHPSQVKEKCIVQMNMKYYYAGKLRLIILIYSKMVHEEQVSI